MIQNIQIKELTKVVLKELSDYFFEAPASTTGKYHPKLGQGKGGLVRHTRGAVKVAEELFRNHTAHNFSDLEKDIIVSSLILHDGKKHLDGGRTYNPLHPKDMAEFIVERFKGTSFEIIAKLIAENISTHMGEWCTDKLSGEVILETPKTEMQKFVHLCDYLASRRGIEIELD